MAKLQLGLVGLAGVVATFVACSSESDGNNQNGTGGVSGFTGGAPSATGGSGAVSTGGVTGGGGIASAGGAAAGGVPGAGGGPGPSAGGFTSAGGTPPTGGGAPSTGAAGGTGTGGGPPTPTGPGCLKAATGDYSKAGPYAVKTEKVDLGTGIDPQQATGEFTISYPDPFDTNCKHPIVAWGNGTGVTGPEVYDFFNHNAATYGVVVIAASDSNTGSGSYHKKGIDYLLAENAKPGSKYFGELSGRAGVSGHSQGGFGAAQASSHPAVQALLPIGASGTARANLSFLCLTGTKDIAPASCKSAVQAAQGPAMAAIWEGGDHTGTETLAGYIGGDKGSIQMMRFYAAWWRCFLADDEKACAMFKGGDNCGICKDPGWSEIVTKNL